MPSEAANDYRCPVCGVLMDVLTVGPDTAITAGMCKDASCPGGLLMHVSKGDTPGDFLANLIRATSWIDDLFHITVGVHQDVEDPPKGNGGTS